MYMYSRDTVLCFCTSFRLEKRAQHDIVEKSISSRGSPSPSTKNKKNKKGFYVTFDIISRIVRRGDKRGNYTNPEYRYEKDFVSLSPFPPITDSPIVTFRSKDLWVYEKKKAFCSRKTYYFLYFSLTLLPQDLDVRRFSTIGIFKKINENINPNRRRRDESPIRRPLVIIHQTTIIRVDEMIYPLFVILVGFLFFYFFFNIGYSVRDCSNSVYFSSQRNHNKRIPTDTDFFERSKLVLFGPLDARCWL